MINTHSLFSLKTKIPNKPASVDFLSELEIGEEVMDGVYFHHCPRLWKWHHRPLHSILHPNTSTLVYHRQSILKSIEDHNLEESAGTLSPSSTVDAVLKSSSFRSLSKIRSKMAQKTRVREVVLLAHQIQRMNPADKFTLLAQIYENQISETGVQEIIDEILDEIALYYPLEYMIGKWWDTMTKKKNPLIDRTSFFHVFMKLYDILIPYHWVANPMEKVEALQNDFRSCCRGRTIGVSYEVFTLHMIELCENWVNTNRENEAFIPQSFAEARNIDVEKLADLYCSFLADLYDKVFTSPSSPTHHPQLQMCFSHQSLPTTKKNRSPNAHILIAKARSASFSEDTMSSFNQEKRRRSSWDGVETEPGETKENNPLPPVRQRRNSLHVKLPSLSVLPSHNSNKSPPTTPPANAGRERTFLASSQKN